jgi:hypothetical protein
MRKLTPKIAHAVLREASRGGNILSCARAAEINRDTLSDWLAKGRKDLAAGKDSVSAHLARAFDQAVAMAREIELQKLLSELDDPKLLVPPDA